MDDTSSKKNAYRIWISEIMLQQTTVPVVKKYFTKFLDQWPTIESLAEADSDEVMACWAGLGYYTRARNLIPCAKIIVQEHNGKFPNSSKELLKLPGIGPYTASAIQSIAFDIAVPVVDGNVERVYSRVCGLTNPLPLSKPEIKKVAEQMTPSERPGDYAQAVMDLGATVCKPRAPKCIICPWQRECTSYRLGLQDKIPYKITRDPKPARKGILFVCLNENNCFLLERRPQNGLLGGTLGWLGSGWDNKSKGIFSDLEGGLELPGEIVHVFSHFKASIRVRVGVVEASEFAGLDIQWIPKEMFDVNTLPTLMKKAYMHACEHFDFCNLEESMRISRN